VLIRFCVIAVFSWVLLASDFQSAAAFDGNRKGFVLGYGMGVGVLASENLWGLHTNLKIGGGVTDRLLIYYSGHSSIFSGGVILEPTAAVSYYPFSGFQALFVTGGLGATVVGSVMGTSAGSHILAGAGLEISRHWNVELSIINIFSDPDWTVHGALTINVIGF
jgi:hypothetical protein